MTQKPELWRVQLHVHFQQLTPSVSETIHEVPHVFGNTPRIVLAVFFAMSEDDEEIFVWS
ncbi:hypothetical protein IH992_20555 [Candidatus Poribacteria bacterium]|nr:hypothetical protein [Candidatus Poribacteria bacterium]